MSGQDFYIRGHEDYRAHQHTRHNLGATADPTGSDDSTAHYSKGSLWVNTVTAAIFMCADPTATVAIWRDITDTGITDHGALAGLADDDHPQYETAAEVLAQIGTHTADASAHHAPTVDTNTHRRVVMRPGITSPPEPVSKVDGDGWVYFEIT